MILVDTSVWVLHFRTPVADLAHLLDNEEVLVHPWVVGEIAFSTPPCRAQTLELLHLLPPCPQATVEEAIALINAQGFYGRGVGLVDVMLLASVRSTPHARLWTLDKRLAGLAGRLGVEYSAPLH